MCGCDGLHHLPFDMYPARGISLFKRSDVYTAAGELYNNAFCRQFIYIHCALSHAGSAHQ